MSSIFSSPTIFNQESCCQSCKSPQQNQDVQISLFTGDIIFQNSDENNNSVDIDTLGNNIENDILNMIDDDPYEENSPTFTCKSSEQELQACTKQDKKASKDVIGDLLDKDESSTQSSNNGSSPKASANVQPFKATDFNKLFGEGTPSLPYSELEKQMKASKKYKTAYDFPDGGWECSSCSNYNFKGRKRCHRCKKEKSQSDHKGKPEHMFMGIEEKKAMKAARQQEKKRARKLAQLEALKNGTAEDDGIDSATPAEFRGKIREGDWACVRCTNFNYAFRDSCNKCGLMQYEHIYYSTNFPPNSIDWNTATTSQQMPPPLPYQHTLLMQQQMQQSPQPVFANLNVFVPQHVQQQQVQQQQEFVQW